MIKIFCETCQQEIEPIIEPLRKDKLNGDKAWGDIVCSKCHFIIATLSSDEECNVTIVTTPIMPDRAHKAVFND